MSEFEFITKLEKLFPEEPKGFLGIGDDCAVFPGRDEGRCITVDAFVEGIHFDTRFSSWEDIGWKALAVSLSDIAAMGASADLAVINLQRPNSLSEESLLRVYAGLAECADSFSVRVLGGNTSTASELSLSTTVIGSVGEKPILRSGMKAGDDIWVSGVLGESFLGWKLLEKQLNPATAIDCINRYRRPIPRLSLAKRLVKSCSLSAMIDISDGLFQDLFHLCIASNSQVEIDLEKIPLAGLKESAAFSNVLDAKTLATAGGDYELLFSAPKSSRLAIQKNEGLTLIGQVTENAPEREGAQVLLSNGDLRRQSLDEYLDGVAAGYQHTFS